MFHNHHQDQWVSERTTHLLERRTCDVIQGENDGCLARNTWRQAHRMRPQQDEASEVILIIFNACEGLKKGETCQAKQ